MALHRRGLQSISASVGNMMEDNDEIPKVQPIKTHLSYEDSDYYVHDRPDVDISYHLLALFPDGEAAEAAYDRHDVSEMLAHQLEGDPTIVDEYGKQRPWSSLTFDLATALENALSERDSDIPVAELWDRWSAAMRDGAVIQAKIEAQLKLGLECFEDLLTNHSALAEGKGLILLISRILDIVGSEEAIIEAINSHARTDPILALKAISKLQDKEA